MVESIDTIILRQYFRVITSEPFSLSALGKGSPEQLEKSWKKIVDEDSSLNKSGSHNRIIELLADRERTFRRALRISACLLVLSRKESESSLEILKSMSIEGKDRQHLFAVAKDRYNGLISQIEAMDRQIGERKRPTMADCMREMMIVKSYMPVSLDSTLAEYRAAQGLIREIKLTNGKSDN